MPCTKSWTALGAAWSCLGEGRPSRRSYAISGYQRWQAATYEPPHATATRITNNHLIPRLGSIKLAALDASAIETMLAELAAAGLSAKTRRNVHGVLSKALADALRWKLVSGNVASQSERPALNPPTVKA